jgi:hypothetical protein
MVPDWMVPDWMVPVWITVSMACISDLEIGTEQEVSKLDKSSQKQIAA